MSRLSSMSRFAEPDLPPKVECVSCTGRNYVDLMIYVGGDVYVCEYCEDDYRKDNED